MIAQSKDSNIAPDGQYIGVFVMRGHDAKKEWSVLRTFELC